MKNKKIEKLLSSQKHFETILEGMSEGILELTPKARIVYCNPVAVSILGMPEKKLLASDFTKLFEENDRQRIRKLLDTPDHTSQLISEDSPIAFGDNQLTLKILPVRDDGNETIVVILDDISLRKEMQTQLIQAQKMEAVGTLAGGIAHDFNNLLMGMQGYISLMLMDIEPTHPHYKRLKVIEDLVESGAELTEQLLDFSRGDKFQVKLNINEVIGKTSKMFGRTKKEINIRRKYQKNIWTVDIDRGQIEQVLLNLYVNAWQAMPEGGDLNLQTEKITLDESHVKPFKTEPGNYVKVSVSDTGVGMDERTKERIFEPFFTTKERGRGTGLGLASVYGIIKNHGGFINVYSEKGKGTTFTICLPASEKEVLKEKSVLH
ncbi:MAG: PAS domain S-box protein [Deltaproteobacteria bacterium]|nr:PAS domain S-box protein [Deltaproteobacteria bacterium]